VGMKSRGVYETPGGTVMLEAHRAMESITLDRGESHLKVRQFPLSLLWDLSECRPTAACCDMCTCVDWPVICDAQLKLNNRYY
jgi:hypothetical protein